jgi:uncharacterized protein (UPF0332 family)/predicted nucleotidyltransferase
MSVFCKKRGIMVARKVSKGKKASKKRNGASAKKSSSERKGNSKKAKPVEKKFFKENPRRERDVAMDFAKRVHEKFDRLVKASILFGSQVREAATAGSDIDIILIVDDSAFEWDLELVSWYREELGKLIASHKYEKDLHVNTVRLTTWWEDLLHGDPVVINILRYGEALLDHGGFFNPIKGLLLKGKIRSTPEAVHAALRRAPAHIIRSKNAEMNAIEGAYWAMVDSAQAALMTAGKIPPSPEHIPEMLKKEFVDNGMLKMNYVKSIGELYSVHKAIERGQVNDIKGQEIDEWQELAEKFLIEMSKIIDVLLDKQM